jgi:hypothetical protein
MSLRDLFLRIRALVAPRHVERETRKHVANGPSPAEARNLALARFGPVPLAADQCRDAH